MYVARHLLVEVDVIEAHLDELSAATPEERRARLEVLAARLMRSTWDEAAKYESELRSALDVARAVIARLESELRQHGLPVPTDRKDSELP
jgi:hypothetical protein